MNKPSLCRNRLRDEGKAYPRSGCAVCKTGGMLGCPYEKKERVSVDKYAVIYTKSIYHEGDERSRTNPGHGYPAYTEQVETIQTFDNLDGLKEWISKKGKYEKFKAIKYQELTISTEIVVNVG